MSQLQDNHRHLPIRELVDDRDRRGDLLIAGMPPGPAEATHPGPTAASRSTASTTMDSRRCGPRTPT